MRMFIMSLFIAAVYIGTMIWPYYATHEKHTLDAKNEYLQLMYGVVHIPSLIYIGVSAFILCIFLKNNVKKNLKLEKELSEAIKITDDNEIIKSGNSFWKTVVDLIRHGGMEEDIELAVERKINNIVLYYEKEMAKYNYIAVILPMLGMLGTITGLLQMFAVSNGIDNIAEKMVGLSVALATTLYATLIVILYVKPKYKKLEEKLMELDHMKHDFVISAKLFLHRIEPHKIQTDEVNNESE